MDFFDLRSSARAAAVAALLLALASPARLAASPPTPAAPPALILENGRWWTGEGFVRSEERYVVGDRFVAERPEGAVRAIDLGELFVVPPYGDSHAHVLESREGAEAESDGFLERGIFYLRNPNNCRTARDEVRDYLARPETVDVAYSNGGLTGPGAHPIPVYESHALGIGPYWLATREQREQMRTSRLRAGDCYHVVAGPEDLETAWPAVLRGEPDFVKVYLDYSERHGVAEAPAADGEPPAGGAPAAKEEPAADEEPAAGTTAADGTAETAEPPPAHVGGVVPAVVPAVVERARAAELPVVAHVETAADFRAAVAAGVDELAHAPGYSAMVRGEREILPEFRITAEDARAAAEAGVRVTPTLYRTVAMDDFVPEENRMGAEARKLLEEFHRELLTTLLDAGVPLALGSDIGGTTSLDEAAYYVKLGVLSPAEALALLTRDTPRAIFPARPVGGLAPGDEASLLALACDPTEDLACLSEIELRVKQGRVLEAASPGLAPEPPPASPRATNPFAGAACTLRATLVGADGRPVPGAWLGVDSLTHRWRDRERRGLVEADEVGRVELALPPDLYQWAAVSAEHPATDAQWLDLTSGCAPAELGRVVLSSGLPLVGRAVDPEGEPVAGARVRVDDPRPELWFLDRLLERVKRYDSREVTTGSDGRFEVTGLVPGLEHEIWVTHPLRQGRGVDATPGNEPLEVILEPAALLEVEVIGADGRPPEGAMARIETFEEEATPWSMSLGIPRGLDADGRYEVGSLDAGKLRVEVRAIGYEQASRDVVVAAGETTQVRLVLEPVPSGEVGLRLVDEAGEPVPGARVVIASTPWVPRTSVDLAARSDDSGRVRWSRVPVGTYTIEVEAPRGLELHVGDHGLPAIEVTTAGVEREIVLPRPEVRRVEGRVVRAGAQDESVPDVVLSIQPGATGDHLAVQPAVAGRLEARTGVDGRFVVERLPLGEHRVYLEVPGVAGVAPQTLRVSANGAPPLLEVPVGVPVAGRLRPTADVDPAGPWRLTARGPGGSGIAGWMDDDLAFRFPPLAPGLWTVEAHNGRAAGAAKLEVVAGAGEARIVIDVSTSPEGISVFPSSPTARGTTSGW